MKIKCPNCKTTFDYNPSKVDTKKQQEELEKKIKKQFEDQIKELQKKANGKGTDIQGIENTLRNSIKKEYDATNKEKLAKQKSDYERKISDLENEKNAIQKELDVERRTKVNLQTKSVGEDLEKWCQTEFEKIQATAYPFAEFGKDTKNSVKTSSKGDFILRDFSDKKDSPSRIELYSIMFEMKNETKSGKQKNEKFLAELDKDRKEKKCEFAVLVTELEKDNELYNQGIVNLSHKYEKMYAVRPAQFLTIINLIKSLSNNNLEDKKQLEVYKKQSFDLTKFKDNLSTFSEQFNEKIKDAHTKYNTVIDMIDTQIIGLQKMKETLTGTGTDLTQANNLLEDLSFNKLIENNPTISKMAEEQGLIEEHNPNKK